MKVDIIGDQGKKEQTPSFMESARIQVEMEKLNTAIADVNRVDGELFEVKMLFERALADSKRKLNKIYRSHRKSIERSRPYFQHKDDVDKLEKELNRAGEMLQKACLDFDDAKENEAVAERLLMTSSSSGFDSCQGADLMENWNKATGQVLDACKIKSQTHEMYNSRKVLMEEARSKLETFAKERKKDVDRGWLYFSMRDALQKQLDQKQESIREKGALLAQAKQIYKDAFAELDLVAVEIEQRKRLKDLKSGMSSMDDLSQFEEIDDIELALESKFENMSESTESLDGSDRFNDSGLGGEGGVSPFVGRRSMSLVEFSNHMVKDSVHPKAITLEDFRDSANSNIFQMDI